MGRGKGANDKENKESTTTTADVVSHRTTTLQNNSPSGNLPIKKKLTRPCSGDQERGLEMTQNNIQ